MKGWRGVDKDWEHARKTEAIFMRLPSNGLVSEEAGTEIATNKSR